MLHWQRSMDRSNKTGIMIRNKTLFFPLIIFSLFLVGLDQFAKHWFVDNFQLYQQWVIIPDFFSFTLAYNKGAAFSFLSDAGGWQRWFFIGVASLVSVVLLVWLARLEKGYKLQAVSLALILGGALGNLWDRAVLGHVVDFILVHYKTSWYFPAFNLADMANHLRIAGIVLTKAIGRGN